jgi:hypothetical protein
LDGTFLWIALGLALLPFIRSIKIGELIALERDIGKTQADVNAVRNELHQNIAMLAANVTATASLRNTVNNNNYVSTSGQIDDQDAPGKQRRPATNLRNGSMNELQSDKGEDSLNQSLDIPSESGPGNSKPATAQRRTETAQACDQAQKFDRVLRHSAMELKILNTLLLHQVIKFPDFVTRFTFRIDFPAQPEASQYEIAVNKLVSEGLINITGDRQVYLTDLGFSYSLKNHHSFPIDAWFDPRVVTDDELENSATLHSHRNA